jgi:hypothetical protein
LNETSACGVEIESSVAGTTTLDRECSYFNFIKLSSAIYSPNAYEVICRIARMAE